MNEPLPLVIVAAVARNGVIGRDNALPWHLKSDLRHFRNLTMGRPMIMGRRTFDSIGRPLPGRDTIVLTRGGATLPPGIHVAGNIESALQLGQERGRVLRADAVVVAGGGDLYAALIDRCDRLYLTEVDLEPAGDARFPRIDPAIWAEISRQDHLAGAGDDAAFAFVQYGRKAPANRLNG